MITIGSGGDREGQEIGTEEWEVLITYNSYSWLIDVHFNLASPVEVLVVFCQVR